MWGEIKKALNDSLGRRRFLPLDKIVKQEAYERFYDTLLLNVPSNTEIVGRENIESINRGENYVVQDEIKNVIIPWGVKFIPDAFCGGKNSVQNVVMPDTIEEIGKNAFRFTSIKYIKFSESLLKIDNTAFANCENLEVIRLPETTRTFGQDVFLSSSNIKEIHTPLPDSWITLENLGIPESATIYYESV